MASFIVLTLQLQLNKRVTPDTMLDVQRRAVEVFSRVPYVVDVRAFPKEGKA